MKVRPILFSAPMVRAILDGSKTQTRRVVKQFDPPPSDLRIPDDIAFFDDSGSVYRTKCPYGQPGDRLWVREAWRAARGWDKTKPALIPQGSPIRFEADGSAINLDAFDEDEPREYGKLRPNIFMPRWASRIDLEITGVRVERLQECSEADAIAEGLKPLGDEEDRTWSVDGTSFTEHEDPRDTYRDLWESINGPGSWNANPWVWVIEFRRIKP